jgi:hypothetical protein
MNSHQALILAFVVGSLAACSAPRSEPAGAQTPPEGKAPPSAEARNSKILSDQSDRILECVAEHLDSSRPTCHVHVELAIDAQGKILSRRVAVSLPPPHEAEVKACVEKIVDALKFAESKMPFVTISRDWDFSVGN